MHTFADFEAGKPLPKGYDCADMVDDGWSKEQIEAFMRATVRTWTPPTAQDRAAGGPSDAAAPSTIPQAARAVGGAAGAAAAHSDIAAMLRRIERLTRFGSLANGERGILAGAVEALEAMRKDCGRELAALEGKPLPDPGCRPDVRVVFYYHMTSGRGFPLVLGYFHRVREYVERLEVKHGGAGGASQ